MFKSRYDWAANPVKLEQAIDQVKVEKGIKEVSEAQAKEAYIKRGGLLVGGEEAGIESEEGSALEDMKVPQLKELAEEKGIDISEAKNKAEIIEILKEAGIE